MINQITKQEMWDRRWMALASHYASFSKDRSHQVGCVIVDENQCQVSEGWNGFPRGVNDDAEERHERPDKYLYTKHAEENAFLNAARKGASTANCTIYIPWFPCANCAGDIVQAGIITVVAYGYDENDPRWADNMAIAKTILSEGGVALRIIEQTEGLRSA